MNKKKNLWCALVALAMTLAMVTSGFASNGGSTLDNGVGSAQALVNGQNNGMMTVTNTGGTPPTEIVVGQTNLQIQPATRNFTGKCMTQALVVNNSAQDASVAGSGATVQSVAANFKGGESFHAGKHFVASTPIEAGLLNTSSIAT